MTLPARPTLLVLLALTVSFLFFQVLPEKNSQASLQSLVRLVEEKQRQEALDDNLAWTREWTEAKRAIVRRLIHRQMTLQEALPAFAEIQRVHLVRFYAKQVYPAPVSQEEIFENILLGIESELIGKPRLACEVTLRLQEEWSVLLQAGKESW